MAAQDGIGAPRRPSTIERERLVLEEAKRLTAIERRGLKYEDAVRVLGEEVTRKQIGYTLERLARNGQLERRNGYNWHPTATEGLIS
jgi:hypothetical protein